MKNRILKKYLTPLKVNVKEKKQLYYKKEATFLFNKEKIKNDSMMNFNILVICAKVMGFKCKSVL